MEKKTYVLPIISHMMLGIVVFNIF